MENQNEPVAENASDWIAPPPPKETVAEPARMSEVGTLGSIFFEPGETFADLRRKPRFLLAGLIIIIAATTFNFLFIQKVGFENIIRARLESNSQVAQLPAEQKQAIIAQQSGPIVKAISYAAIPVVLIIVFLIGGLIYWGGANVMGGNATFAGGLSVWIYSSFPPTVVSMLANILILFLKSTDDIDIATSQNGLVRANPSFLVDMHSQKVLGALLGTFDLFFIWGWILAAIGLRVVGKISTGSAWAIVLFGALFNIAFRVIGALFS
jgi:hypothetical protein